MMLTSRLRWNPNELNVGEGDKWESGVVCNPLTGLHYAGPGMGLELAFDFASMYPSCARSTSRRRPPSPVLPQCSLTICPAGCVTTGKGRASSTPRLFSSTTKFGAGSYERPPFSLPQWSTISSDGRTSRENSNLPRWARPSGPTTRCRSTKLKKAGAQVPAFLKYVHATLVEDTLERMFVIGGGNVHRKLTRDPMGRFTEEGYPVYVAKVPRFEEGGRAADVTGPFVKDRRVKLEYESSAFVYCHVAKKTYVALTHNLDDKGELCSVGVKVRGLSAFKSVRSPSIRRSRTPS